MSADVEKIYFIEEASTFLKECVDAQHRARMLKLHAAWNNQELWPKERPDGLTLRDWMDQYNAIELGDEQ